MEYDMRGREAFDKLVNEFNFNTVLDIGCGTGDHTKEFIQNNKVVTPVDVQKLIPGVILGNYMDLDITHKYDCVWASHILEHQLNPNTFLKKINSNLKDGGVLCITVPPKKDKIVGGHVNLYNAGLLIYQLVLAGFNCKNIKIKQYGYNISIILIKEEIELPDNLHFDNGDIEKLSSYFPEGYNYQGFNGDIKELNWD